jgi:hypothetical protein
MTAHYLLASFLCHQRQCKEQWPLDMADDTCSPTGTQPHLIAADCREYVVVHLYQAPGLEAPELGSGKVGRNLTAHLRKLLVTVYCKLRVLSSLLVFASAMKGVVLPAFQSV